MLLEPSNLLYVKPVVLFQPTIRLKRIKNKAKFPAVDRGDVNLKVIRDMSGMSFCFVGKVTKAA